MALRVTQGLMYNSFITGMNNTLSAYMESNMQSSSQKRVNRPSDDPVSAGRILETRATLSRLSDYDANSKMAMGWLGLADNILGSGDGSVLTVLSLIKFQASYKAAAKLITTADEMMQTLLGLKQ